MVTVGIVDTTFARYDMGKVAFDTIAELAPHVKIIRRTVPGIKDLPVACKILIEEHGCDAVMAIGMPGSKPIDAQCAHQASIGLITCQLMTNTHIIECFVFENEAKSEEELAEICRDRAFKHAMHLVKIALKDHEWFAPRAGGGYRQGHPDAGPLLE